MLKKIKQHNIYYWLYAERFGKTVFLIREEAEKALKERADNG